MRHIGEIEQRLYARFHARKVVGAESSHAMRPTSRWTRLCTQVMSEFCDPSFKVYIVKGREEVLQYQQLVDFLQQK